MKLKNIKNGIFKKFKNSKITTKTPKNQKVKKFKKSYIDTSNEKSSKKKIYVDLKNIKNDIFQS